MNTQTRTISVSADIPRDGQRQEPIEARAMYAPQQDRAAPSSRFPRASAPISPGYLHRKMHQKVSEAAGDNSGVKAAHKAERLGEYAVGFAYSKAKAEVRNFQQQRALYKADIHKLQSEYGNGNAKELIHRAYGKDIAPDKLDKSGIEQLRRKYGDNNINQLLKKVYGSDVKSQASGVMSVQQRAVYSSELEKLRNKMPNDIVMRSNRLNYQATMAMPAGALGSRVVDRPVQSRIPSTGKGIVHSASMAGGRFIRGKLDQAGQDNAGVSSVLAVEEAAKPHAARALKYGARQVNTLAARSPVGQAMQGAKQRTRRWVANRQRKFLAKHQNIAKARGIVMKAKA